MQLTLVKKKKEVKNTYSFFFKPKKKVTWKPGQYIYLTLKNTIHPFTIASSSTEGNLLQVTTRIRDNSEFKQNLNKLKIGTNLETKNPNGYFVFPDNPSPNTFHLFLAGGIGITPFRSFIKYCVDKKLKTPLHLIYSNSGSGFVFKKELDKWEKENKFLKIKYHNSTTSGHINKHKINKLINDWELKTKNCTYWIVGPSPFVNAMEDILEELKIPEKNTKTEKFGGY